MVPRWISNMLKGGCPNCDGKLSINDVESIGVQRPSSHDKYPLAIIVVDCPSCDQMIRFLDPQPAAPLFRAVSVFYEQFRKFARNGSNKKLQPPSNPDQFCTGGPVDLFDTLVPSRSEKHPRKPITDEEVESFRKLLQDTSFRRESKSWQDFLSRLDIKPEWLEDDEDHNDDGEGNEVKSDE